ncbi:uncharacterized protein LOC123789627 [Ursus americanus]|uniref:uncharacterized protein LOC123789627 n=1 Tax=Ursus americanus TaxID=9643 RepID=UPI001E67C1A7|nr:uncharacterized protein LOC123789627 [Ursus americanus]
MCAKWKTHSRCQRRHQKKMRGSIPPNCVHDLSRNRESDPALTAPPRRPSLHPSNVAAGRLKMPSMGGILSLLGAGVLDHRFQASGFLGQAGSPKSDYQPSASLSKHHCTGDGCSDSREKEAIARLESREPLPAAPGFVLSLPGVSRPTPEAPSPSSGKGCGVGTRDFSLWQHEPLSDHPPDMGQRTASSRVITLTPTVVTAASRPLSDCLRYY